MIGRPVLKAICSIDLEFVFQISEPESARVEKCERDPQHASTVVRHRDSRTRRAVPFHKTSGKNRCGRAHRTLQFPHAHEMRLETVIIGGIADGALAAGELLELADRLDRFRPEWFLDQHMLAVTQAIGEDLLFRPSGMQQRAAP